MDDPTTKQNEKPRDTGQRTIQPAPMSGGADQSLAEERDRTTEQAKTTGRNLGEQARSAAATAREGAQQMVQRVREQTESATGALYDQGTRAGDYMARSVNEYPLSAILVAGAIGYGIAFLVHGNWNLRGNWSDRDSDGERKHGQDQRNARRNRRD